MVKYTNLKEGLNNNEVENNRRIYGMNDLGKKEENSFFKLFIQSLSDPIIKILLIALAIKIVFLIKSFDWYETVGIVIAIFLASFISSISEYGSEKAFNKLQEEASKIKCKVIRNSKIIEVNVDEVVVGDVLLLSSGEKIAADGILKEGNISVDESFLNGESKERYIGIDDQIYRGSIISSGIGKMIVTNVGVNTFYGKLAQGLKEKSPETPLKLKLRELAKIISKIGYIAAFLVSFSYLFSEIVINNNFEIDKIISTITSFPKMAHYILYSLTLAVTIIVVAVPEGYGK